jgi:hypothetical protein
MAIFWCREHDFNHTWNYEQLKPWPKPQIKHGKKDILRTHSNRLGAHRHKKYFVRQIQEIAEPLIYETTKLLD